MLVARLMRYPIKSLGGEVLERVEVGSGGLAGDRRAALWDLETEAVVSGKHPRRYPGLGGLQAAETGSGVVVRLPSGERVEVPSRRADEALSQALGRRVRVVEQAPEDATIHRLWPEVEDLAPEAVREASTPTAEAGVTSGALALFAPGTLFDVAPIHMVFTPSLRRLSALCGFSVDAERFRPNVIVEVEGDEFVEDGLVGQRLSLGASVVLQLDLHSPRCIVPTRGADGHDRGPEPLRSLAKHHRREVAGLGRFACLGVYASVVSPGTVRPGDEVRVLA